MRIFLDHLKIDFRRSTEFVRFRQISYFYGKMGAGKSSIARLIDFCLGGNLELSPAFQNEFIGVALSLAVEDTQLSLERQRESDQIIASWDRDGEAYSIVIPARKANGPALPDSDVEVVSDLIFYLADMRPPRVRKSKQNDDSDLIRLSLRNLLWYCYLDQKSIDSSFFHLDPDANPFKRNPSRDALRFIVGYHQEKVAELEAELREVQSERRQFHRKAESLEKALEESGVASEDDLNDHVEEARQIIAGIDSAIDRTRHQIEEELAPEHGVEMLQNRGRELSYELESIDEAIPQVLRLIDRDTRYMNELRVFGVKLKRAATARAVIGGVSFERCPRCAQQLPERNVGECTVCGKEEPINGSDNLDVGVLETDAADRINDLKEAVDRHTKQITQMRRRRREIADAKARVDRQINEERRRYDSAFLSRVLALERQRAAIEERIDAWQRLAKLPQRVIALRRQADGLESTIAELRRVLELARAEAEEDTQNVERLEQLFLDCLVRAQLPGVEETDEVTIDPSDFYPRITKPSADDSSVTTFLSLESGGKMTMFKSCFALAIHRLARMVGAALPTFLIIDSPTKNISERQNEVQFEGFHNLIYELAQGELSQTQFVVIDKEFSPPPAQFKLDMYSRLMNPDDSDHPPLIPYYKGH